MSFHCRNNSSFFEWSKYENKMSAMVTQWKIVSRRKVIRTLPSPWATPTFMSSREFSRHSFENCLIHFSPICCSQESHKVFYDAHSVKILSEQFFKMKRMISLTNKKLSFSYRNHLAGSETSRDAWIIQNASRTEQVNRSCHAETSRQGAAFQWFQQDDITRPCHRIWPHIGPTTTA